MTSDDLWIFGYGSLMWRPGFAYLERRRARLTGYHRCFCITSTHHRGSPHRPGLVLGLDRGGVCDGIAYRVAAPEAAGVLAYLRERELVNGVYREVRAPVRLGGGATASCTAIAYVAAREHPSYAGRLPLHVQAHRIRGARGLSGENLDYLVNTVRHLADLGIRERELERLVALAATLVARPSAASGHRDSMTYPASAALRRVVARLPDRVLKLPKGERRRFLYRLRVATAASARSSRDPACHNL
jgi:cation transport protein ChaC